jgi:hypothetical protein
MSRPFYPPGVGDTHWVGPRAGLDSVAKNIPQLEIGTWSSSPYLAPSPFDWCTPKKTPALFWLKTEWPKEPVWIWWHHVSRLSELAAYGITDYVVISYLKRSYSINWITKACVYGDEWQYYVRMTEAAMTWLNVTSSHVTTDILHLTHSLPLSTLVDLITHA